MNTHDINFLDLLDGQIQYVVPRWQRRYCWGEADIERLVDDLLTVADAQQPASHYGGTLLTFDDPDTAGTSGVVKTYRVVDGQQRLTTVSILLACIAKKLGPEGKCGDWTRQVIYDDRLTNPRKSPEKSRKLRLQKGDEEEYRRGLEGSPDGAGAVTQAWRIAGRLVAQNDVEALFRGLGRLRVVNIGLVGGEDPQQIFESLNATGRPLTESEKVKNWLLMGLKIAQQQALHDEHWLQIESVLKAGYTTESVDIFLRDFLRWRTGKVQGIGRVYDDLRRWAIKFGKAEDRPALCRELARLAKLYGILTGTAGPHRNSKVERQLRHLRGMEIDVHRPLTLRLLNDVESEAAPGATGEALAKIFEGVGTWITRLWLADRSTAGMNRAIAELAHEPGPGEDEDFAEHWLGRVRRLRNTRVGVPNDEQVREGIHSRTAYGGSTTRSTFAVLCALMEADHREESPARERLTIEHVMPRKLTDDWKRDLGDTAEETHGRYRDRLANLTLSGDATNSGMGADTFDAKQAVYVGSPIGLTSILAKENSWNEAALERRAEYLADRALEQWPWFVPETHEGEAQDQTPPLRWRIEDGDWNVEREAYRMVLNVAASLLSRDATNAQRLSGEAITSNLHPAKRYPAASRVRSALMHGVPGHEDWVLHPYAGSYPASAERCRKMGERCSVRVEVEFEEESRSQTFWNVLKERTGGLPGQKDSWRGANQWTSPLNSSGDRVGFYIGNSELLWLYIWTEGSPGSADRTARAQQYSRMIQDQMSDQEIGGNLEKESEAGRTVSVQRHWALDDEAEWPAYARWIKEQQERLQAILAGSPSES